MLDRLHLNTSSACNALLTRHNSQEGKDDWVAHYERLARAFVDGKEDRVAKQAVVHRQVAPDCNVPVEKLQSVLMEDTVSAWNAKIRRGKTKINSIFASMSSDGVRLNLAMNWIEHAVDLVLGSHNILCFYQLLSD